MGDTKFLYRFSKPELYCNKLNSMRKPYKYRISTVFKYRKPCYKTPWYSTKQQLTTQIFNKHYAINKQMYIRGADATSEYLLLFKNSKTRFVARRELLHKNFYSS